MNVTKHCIQRYAIRFKDIDEQDLGAITQAEK